MLLKLVRIVVVRLIVRLMVRLMNRFMRGLIMWLMSRFIVRFMKRFIVRLVRRWFIVRLMRRWIKVRFVWWFVVWLMVRFMGGFVMGLWMLRGWWGKVIVHQGLIMVDRLMRFMVRLVVRVMVDRFMRFMIRVMVGLVVRVMVRFRVDRFVMGLVIDTVDRLIMQVTMWFVLMRWRMMRRNMTFHPMVDCDIIRPVQFGRIRGAVVSDGLR